MKGRTAIYELVNGDKYRRRKLKQGKGHHLEPEWDPDDETQRHSEDELVEFLNGRIDGLLFAWSGLTGWGLSDLGAEIHQREDTAWRADPWDWIDLSVVPDAENEMQCPGCGDIYDQDALLWIDPSELSNRTERWGLCDACADRWVERERMAAAEQRRAEKIGGQTPIDSRR